MSWVRLERDAESEPASPGESERPVPSIREVTRRVGFGEESSREQMTPAKAEQGRGEAKSHVEKK